MTAPVFGAPLCDRCRKSGTVRLAVCYRDQMEVFGKRRIPVGRLYLCNEHYGKMDVLTTKGFKHMTRGRVGDTDE